MILNSPDPMFVIENGLFDLTLHDTDLSYHHSEHNFQAQRKI